MNNALYAWVTRLPDGGTSLVGTLIGKLHTPLISTSLRLATSFRPIAEEHAKNSGQPVSLKRYELAETLHEFTP
jgi:hypothetical protein